MNHNDIIEHAAQLLSTYTTCDGQPHATELHRRQAHALSDAGLLARTLPSYDEIVDACRNGMNAGGPFPWPAADGVMALLKGQEA